MSASSNPEPIAPSALGVFPAPLFRPRRLRMMEMALIFLCGAAVGGIAGYRVAHHHLLTILKHPEQVPDRILPRVRSGLGLSDDQARRVEEIVRRRHSAMESVRARSYPRLLAEFQAMRDEVAGVLNSDQRERWRRFAESAENRYLPPPPSVE